jgi:hypothetical protein
LAFFSPQKTGNLRKNVSYFLWGCHNAKIPPSTQNNNPTVQYNLLSLFKTLSESKVSWLAHVPKVMLKRRGKGSLFTKNNRFCFKSYLV